MSTVVSLKARARIENQLDMLIDRAEKLVDSTNIAAELLPAQLRNLLNMASSTDSFKAVELFIQYQMGRRGEGERWRHGGFGDQLIEELHHFDDIAEQIAKETKADKVKVKMELVRLFIGYLTRYFSYKSADKERPPRERTL
jgi:hypothetical protein